MNILEKKPSLVVLAGPSGSGKTTLARRIQGVYTGPIFLQDIDLGINYEGPANQRSSGPKGSEEMNAAYKAMQMRTRALLNEGVNVLYVATNRSIKAQEAVINLANECGANLNAYQLDAGFGDLASRVRQRPPDHISGITTVTALESMLSDFHDFPGSRRINTSKISVDAAARLIIFEVWGPEHCQPDNLSSFIGFLRQKRAFQKQRTG